MAAERNLAAALEQALTPSVLLDRFPKVLGCRGTPPLLHLPVLACQLISVSLSNTRPSRTHRTQAVLDVYVTIIETDGSHLGAAITAASAALADASSELYDLVPACHVVGRRGCCVWEAPAQRPTPVMSLPLDPEGGGGNGRPLPALRSLAASSSDACLARMLAKYTSLRPRQAPPPHLTPAIRSCAQVRVNGCLMLDPTSAEEGRSDGSLLLAMQPVSNEVRHQGRAGHARAIASAPL